MHSGHWLPPDTNASDPCLTHHVVFVFHVQLLKLRRFASEYTQIKLNRRSYFQGGESLDDTEVMPVWLPRTTNPSAKQLDTRAHTQGRQAAWRSVRGFRTLLLNIRKGTFEISRRCGYVHGVSTEHGQDEQK